MVVSLTLGFIHFAIVGQSEDLKKKRFIWLIFCSKSGGYLCACVLKFVYVLMLVRTYIRMFVYVLACIFIYLHIFPLSVDEKGVRRRKRM